MTTIELEIAEPLLTEVDKAAARIGVSRTTFMTAAIKHVLRVHYVKDLTPEDEANAFLLWLVDDDEDDEWNEGRDGGNPWDRPEDNRLN